MTIKEMRDAVLREYPVALPVRNNHGVGILRGPQDMHECGFGADAAEAWADAYAKLSKPSCTCPETMWTGSEINDSTCELSEEEHADLAAAPVDVLPPLDVTEEDWKLAASIEVGQNVTNAFEESMLMQIICRERQLLAAQKRVAELEAQTDESLDYRQNEQTQWDKHFDELEAKNAELEADRAALREALGCEDYRRAWAILERIPAPVSEGAEKCQS